MTYTNTNPATPGHGPVIPKQPAQDLLAIDPSDLAACANTAQRIAGRVVERLGVDGVNILKCCGSDAWQTVFHFHLHVVPRFAADPSRDALALPWIPTPVHPHAIAEIARRLSVEC